MRECVWFNIPLDTWVRVSLRFTVMFMVWPGMVCDLCGIFTDHRYRCMSSVSVLQLNFLFKVKPGTAEGYN